MWTTNVKMEIGQIDILDNDLSGEAQILID